MITARSISETPNLPGVYAMYGGTAVAYVGMSKSIRHRLVQHLVSRDSSVTTGSSAAVLNASAITDVRWWLSTEFSDGATLAAAELVAFDVFEPTLRSRSAALKEAVKFHKDPDFHARMKVLLAGEPDGVYHLPSLPEALTCIVALEDALSRLAHRVEQLEAGSR